MEALKVWAGDKEVIAPTFFFWNPGIAEQKSIQGMLRSILYQLISEHRNLGLNLGLPDDGEPAWTVKRLITALRIILHKQNTDLKICVVIDGLDEFDGDADSRERLMSFIIQDLQGSNVKTVVSSRPEPFLMDVFGHCRGLRLQDLTERDIRTYVNGKLFAIPRMKRLQIESKDGVNMLRNTICEKAEGVFMWVRLAVQDLIAGLRNRDSLRLLQKRLNLLHGSLDGLFSQLIDQIHPVVSPYFHNLGSSEKLIEHSSFVVS